MSPEINQILINLNPEVTQTRKKDSAKKPKKYRKKGKMLALTWSSRDITTAECDYKQLIKDMLLKRMAGYGVRRWIIAR